MKWLVAGASLLVWAGSSLAGTNFSAWVYPASSGRLLYRPDYLGNRIVDASGVGYKGGTVPLPLSNTVPARITVSPVAGDNCVAIQSAINYVQGLPLDANGFRGAVLLAPGEYQLSNTLRITASGVVLRGSGSDTNGTVLRATRTNQYTLVYVVGSASASIVSGTTHTITNLYVPVGARSFQVDSTANLAVGNRVFVRRVATTNWIHDLGMDLLCCEPDVHIWTPSGYNIDMDRLITRIEGNRVFIDAPVTCAIDANYTNGTIRKFTWSGRIQNCGVEHLRGVSDYNTGVTDDENHGWTFVQFGVTENGWARDLVSQHFGYSCVSISGNCKGITVADCRSLDPVSIITGGRRYAFNLSGSLCLFQNCYTDEDRHQFVTGSMTIGPNVFVDGWSDVAKSDAGPHHRWATAGIWDNITVNGNSLNIQNRGNLGSGHGWAGANCVAYNCYASGGYVVQNPPGAHNWLIGSVGGIHNGTVYVGPHDPGTYDSSGSTATNVFPQSLYYAQLQDRLAAPNLVTREYWLGDIDGFTNTSPAGETVPLDADWSNAVAAAAQGEPLHGFDIVTNGHWVPFTFNFSLAATDRVVAASLALSLRSATGATNLTICFDSPTNAFSFAGLGWLPVSTNANPTNATVRVMDLTALTNLLADGKLNVAVQDDVGIDWAMLQLEVAPVLTAGSTAILPAADATVRGGTYANSNFGTATTLTVKEDTSADNDRKALLRWDLSGVTGSVYQAKIRLTAVSVGTDGIEQAVAISTNDSWSEAGVTWNNQPAAGKRFATWIAGTNGPTECIVTPQVLEALAGDRQLTLQLFSVRNAGASGAVDYASRESADPDSRPQLLLLGSASPPVISDITNRTVAVNDSTGPMDFTVGDEETPVADLVVTGTSSNTNLVPADGIVFGGGGSNRTVTVTPATNLSGIAVITITVTDTNNLSASDNFTLTVSSHPAGVYVWNGPGAGANDWSTAGNWVPAGPPEALDAIKFFDGGAGGVGVSNVNNEVDASFGGTIASLQYGNTNGNHTTLIGAGQTLRVSGAAGLTAGTETDNGNTQAVLATVTGPDGALQMDEPAANLIVRQGTATNNTQRATLEMSGLGSFSATLSRILVGVLGPVNRPVGTLILARTNTLVVSGAAPAIDAGDSGSNGGSPNFIQLGLANDILADTITIGRQKSAATLSFNPIFTNLSPTLRLRGASADRVATLAIGDNSAQSASGSSSSGVVDLSNGTLDAMVDTVFVGKGQAGNGGGAATGTLTLNAGTLDVNTLEAGYQNATDAVGVARGTVNVNGTATLVVNGSMRLARFTGSGTVPVGTLNVNGGTVTPNGGIVAGGGTSAITLNSATLNLTNVTATIGTPAAAIGSLTVTNSTLQFAGAATTNIVVANLTTGGSVNTVRMTSLPDFGGYPARVTLVKYNGGIGGAGYNFVLGELPAAPICGAYLSNNAANGSVDLVITNCFVPDAFLTWDGTVDGDWDTTTANWKNNLGPGLVYSDGADVVFNDTAAGPANINLTETLMPASVTVSNNTTLYAFVDEGKLSGAAGLSKQGPGTLIIANSGFNDFSGGVTVDGGVLCVGNGGTNGMLPAGGIADNAGLVFNRADPLTVPGVISGSGRVVQRGDGVLTLSGANTFTGQMIVTNGTLVAGDPSALGAAAGNTVVTNGGTLDVNGLNLTAEPVMVAGPGAGGRGALVNNSGTNQTSALRQVTLAGDVTFGGTNRWDIRNTGGTASLNTYPPGNACNITKVGTNQVSLVAVTAVDPALGDIDVREGVFAIQSSTAQLGDSNRTITVFNNAILNVWALSAGPLNKRISLQDGATYWSDSGTTTNIGPVTLSGGTATLLNDDGTVLRFQGNSVSGPGTLVKTGTGLTVLAGTNTYLGGTVIRQGTLALAGTADLASSPAIAVDGGATLDVSARTDGTLTLISGQSLSGDGTISGGLTASAGATVSPGGSVGVLTVTHVVTLQGVTFMELDALDGTNDVIGGAQAIHYGGTLSLTNLHGTLDTNASFKLFDAANYAGAFASIVPAVPAEGLAWDAGSLSTSGTLKVTLPRLRISSIALSETNVVIAGVNGATNGTCYVLASTNAALPLSNWSVLATNVFDGNGHFHFTNGLDPDFRWRFFLLQSP